MNFLDTAAILLTLAAVFGYINHKVFKLPTSIGILLIGLGLSVLLLLFGGDALRERADTFVSEIDFNRAVMNVMLSFLLFAGALHVNLGDLRDQKWVVAILASVGLLVSTFLVGTASYFVFSWTGFAVPYLWCLVFGALISPTDPVAVLGILKKAGAPKSLETKITGESLFNDGVGVVVYLVLVGLAVGEQDATVMSVGELFVVEVGGGLLLGGAVGFLAYWMLKTIDNYQIEVLITLALVTGGYQLASSWHLSGPLAMVVAGLMIGNQGRLMAMSDTTREHLDLFWELIDEVLNALLFLLIGLEIFILDWSGPALLAGLVMIGVVLASRMVAVSLPVVVLKRSRTFSPGVIRILTWGGLRGG
ncbi:MAG: CPA1 family monovalent cation:H+ antiporter, partial [Granulosicoccus sp.]